MNWINIAGIAGIIFFIGFLGWFIGHPISRDRVLVEFGRKYFVLLVCIILSSVSVIALFNNILPCPKSDVDVKSWLAAMQYCVKMRDVGGDNLCGITVSAIMLFQIVVFEGLVVAAIVGWTSRRTKRLQKGQVRYCKLALKGILWKKKYAVVVGANEVAPSVIKNLLKREDKKHHSLDYAHEAENQYVILQTSSDVGEVRQSLKSYLTEDEYDRVIIYSDLRNSYEGLEKLHLAKASEIYVLGENTTIDGGETYHDSMNMRCVNMIAKVLVEGKTTTLNQRIEKLKKRVDQLDAKNNRQDNNYTKKEKNKIENRIKRLKKRIAKINDKIEKRKKVCKVLFEYQTTYSIFQFSDVPKEVNMAMHFIPFNRYESWARRVMVDNKALALVDENANSKCNQQITYTPLDGYEGLKPNDTQRVHFIVVGMSKMGVAMGTQALFQAHYPNYVKDNSLKSRITFIDANAEQEMNFFKGRYATLFELARHRYIDANTCKENQFNSRFGWVDPTRRKDYKWKHLSKHGKNFLDVEIEFVKGELESEGVREYLRQVTADKKSKVTIAICLPLTHQAVAAALYMPNEVYDNVQEIWVYQREAADIIQNLTQGDKEDLNIRYKKLKPFGMLYGEYIDRRTYYLKALLVNGIYDINDIDNKMYFTKINLGDKDTYIDLRKSWKNLTVEKTWSNKYFVDTIYQKVRSTNLALSEVAAIIGYNNNEFFTGNWKENLENALAELSKPIGQDKKEYLAECEHNRWNVQQLLLGFSPADAKKFAELCEDHAKEKAEVSPIKDEIGGYVKDKNITDQLVELNKKIHYTNGDVENKSFTSLLEFITKEKITGIDERLLADIMTLAEKEKKIKDKQKTLKDKKADLKSPKNKIHYCICDFNHLEAVDPGAKYYDEKLNNGIPIILKLVDGYHCSTQQ